MRQGNNPIWLDKYTYDCMNTYMSCTEIEYKLKLSKIHSNILITLSTYI